MEKERFNNFEEKGTVVKETVLVKKEEPQKEIKLSKTAKQAWFQFVFEAKQEFPEDVQKTIEKIAAGEHMSLSEQIRFDVTLNPWWKERFGFSFGKKKKRKEFLQRKSAEEKRLLRKTFREKLGIDEKVTINRYENAKEDRMRRLHVALHQLDADEPIGEFEYATRRKAFYNKDKDVFVLSDNEDKGLFTLGDILSDYAWDIKYAPDFAEMSDDLGMARQIAKRILINEARRDIETIYNLELSSQHQGASGVQRIDALLSGQKKLTKETGKTGVLAEVMAREALSRIAVNHDLGFVVLRANSLEDGWYKYDFKVHTKERKRGVEVEDEENFEKRLLSIGIQFTTSNMGGGKKAEIMNAKKVYGAEIPVDDIVLIEIHSHEFQEAFGKWMRLGKPSGGPEQFLSKELKTDLLMQATRGIVKIKKEALEHLFEKPDSKEAVL